MSRLNSIVSTLQARLSQTTETLTRTNRLDVVSGDVDEIDPPDNIADYAQKAKQVGIVRENLRKFVNDVWEPGYRIEGPDSTRAFFMGTDEIDASIPVDVPDDVARNGFLDNATIYAGEKQQPFYYFGKQCSWERRVRGTVLVNLLKADKEDPDSEIHGFDFTAPETVYPRVIENTNILLPPDPDDLPEGVDTANVEMTRRGELAAYVQFDDQAILGRHRDDPFADDEEIPLSQNDVKKQVYEPDIGSPGKNDSGVFGTSIIEAINKDIEEYQNVKRDRANAIKTKAYGLWTAQFNETVMELPNGPPEIKRWEDGEMDSLKNEISNSGPGDVITHDGDIELDRLTGEVPELDDVLKHYVEDIMAPLPAPKYKVGFADEINRDVTGEQSDDYSQTISEERQYQERWWSNVLRIVAERWGLDSEGLEFKIEPEPSDSPVKSLSSDEMDKLNTYAKALSTLAGPQAGPQTLVDRETLLDDVAQLPEEVAQGEIDTPEIEEDAETQQEFRELMDIEALGNRYSEGDVVMSPQGKGVVADVIKSGFEDTSGEKRRASSNSPLYAVLLKDGRVMSEFYKASQLEEREEIDSGVENPEADLEAMMDILHADESVDAETMSTFKWPKSWRESDTPARVIALDAFASMGGSFDGCEREMRGNISGDPADFCADFIDRLVGHEFWRGGSWAPGD